ncbi:MAG: tryptophan--tRNA ligase [Promethearchaeota archaeon Loki_b31]|nr:MAG: tryptophan--tRNA ligase [Candidatus Lokiarchaeota archaeon Loki_b31]
MPDFIVTPWEVSGEVDYDLLIQEFGIEPIDEKLLFNLKEITKEIHPYLRRKIFFAHRDFQWILQEYKKGNPFYLYTGRGPSGNIHLGHILPWIFTKWIQEKFNVDLWFQLTDDEKFLFNQSITLEETHNFGYDNALDVIALGFNPKKTYIFSDIDLGNTFYRNALKIAKKITFSTIKATFGLDNSANIGQIFYTSIQAVPAILKSLIEEKNVPCLIPHAVDQDPHFRLSRDVLPKLGYYKPASIQCVFLPSLQQNGKMSASVENTAIFTKDEPDVVKRKVNNAFTGGQANAKLQRELGGNPSVCSVYKYHFMLFTLDDNEIKRIQSKCRGGELLCGECKKDLIQKINKFLSEHQKQREKAKDVLEDYLLREKVDLKSLINEKKKKWNY